MRRPKAHRAREAHLVVHLNIQLNLLASQRSDPATVSVSLEAGQRRCRRRVHGREGFTTHLINMMG